MDVRKDCFRYRSRAACTFVLVSWQPPVCVPLWDRQSFGPQRGHEHFLVMRRPANPVACVAAVAYVDQVSAYVLAPVNVVAHLQRLCNGVPQKKHGTMRGLSLLISARPYPRRAVPLPWRAFHHDKSRRLQVPRQMFGGDLGHHLAAGLELLAPVERQSVCQRLAKVVGIGGAERLRFVRHAARVARQNGTNQEQTLFGRCTGRLSVGPA